MPAHSVAPVRERLTRLAGYAALILFVAVSFLFSPRPRTDADYCGRYVQLGSHMGFTFNCDATEFCRSAASPGRLLEPQAVRQSRPLYVLAGAAVGHPLHWVLQSLNLPLVNRFGAPAAQYVGYYGGYILLNFLLLLGTLYLFDEIAATITRGRIGKGVLVAFRLALISNQVTKAFFWTAHQQFFALFTPLLTIFLVLRILRQRNNATEIAGLSLLSGFLMLVYGNFLPMFVCLVLASFLVDRQLHPVASAKNWILFLAPTLVWVSICVLKNGQYYNHEVEQYRQLVWIIDSLRVSFGRFAAVLLENILAFFRTFREITVFILAAVALCPYWRKRQAENGESRADFATLMGVFFVFGVFYMLLGLYEERLTFTLYPIVLCALILCVSTIDKVRRWQPQFVFLSICWHLYNVMSYGPFS